MDSERKKILPEIFSSSGIIFVCATDHGYVDNQVNEDNNREKRHIIRSLAILQERIILLTGYQNFKLVYKQKL